VEGKTFVREPCGVGAPAAGVLLALEGSPPPLTPVEIAELELRGVELLGKEEPPII
jgi:hypothetical protein